MSSGIFLPSAITLIASTSRALVFSPSDLTEVDISGGPWTPPQYSQPALTILSVVQPPFTISPRQGSPVQTDYVFDAIFRINHQRRLRKTSHPVLTGANISDHAYLEPSRVTLEIGMSDSMASYSNGVWTGFSTKSISAWQVIKGFEVNKTLITLTTRLDTYVNMLVVEATAPDDHKTKHALKATIVLEELLAASVQSVPPVSARNQTTGSTTNGIVQSTTPNSSQVQQNVIPSSLYPDVQTYPQVPGAGSVSSNSLSRVTP